MLVRAAVCAAALAFAVPAAHGQAVPGNPVDAVMSSNVEYLGSLHYDVGLTTGARIVGKRLFVTSGKNISIYDIENPADPQLLGFIPNAVWENEEVPTNGKILVFASDFYSAHPGNCARGPLSGCIQVFDVRDPENPVQLATMNESNHTAECALDCQFLYGSAGDIVDLRGVLEGKAPKVIGDWKAAIKDEGITSASCHHIREIRPGVLLTACRPFSVISINAEDGGSPENPKVLAFGKAADFVHSARWPRGGTDEWVMTGGEENFTARCENNTSEFSTYSAEDVNKGKSNEFQLVDQIVPAGNGVYADGKPIAGALGCSVHWFMEHESFKNGGLVALSEYENGVRFLQIEHDGHIADVGYFLGLGSASSSPKWVPGTDILYSVDYYRGLDILRWNGAHYVPQGNSGKVKDEEGVVPAPNSVQRSFRRAQSRLQRVDQAAMVSQLRANGWFPGYCRLTSQRQKVL